MLEVLKKKVYKANLDLVKHNLVLFTWGNVSEIDRESGLVVIKPSGVSYDEMEVEDMVIVDLDGNIIEGELNPSSDTPTHLELYKNFPKIGGITHTHSVNATAFAQAGRAIPAYGTTHADYMYGDIPCARKLTKQEVDGEYEKNTGKVITESFEDKDLMATPGCLVANHGVFAFGKDSNNSVYNAVVIENVAEMAIKTEIINKDAGRVDQYLLDKHYFRKHGASAYYGQNKG